MTHFSYLSLSYFHFHSICPWLSLHKTSLMKWKRKRNFVLNFRAFRDFPRNKHVCAEWDFRVRPTNTSNNLGSKTILRRINLNVTQKMISSNSSRNIGHLTISKNWTWSPETFPSVEFFYKITNFYIYQKKCQFLSVC